MKSEILKKLENLLETENILSVQREFKQLSAQFRSLAAHGIADIDESEEDHEDDEHEDEVHREHKSVEVEKTGAESGEKQSEEKVDTVADATPTSSPNEAEKDLIEEPKASEEPKAKEDKPSEEKIGSQPEPETVSAEPTHEPTQVDKPESETTQASEEKTNTESQETEPSDEPVTTEAESSTEAKTDTHPEVTEPSAEPVVNEAGSPTEEKADTQPEATEPSAEPAATETELPTEEKADTQPEATEPSAEPAATEAESPADDKKEIAEAKQKADTKQETSETKKEAGDADEVAVTEQEVDSKDDSSDQASKKDASESLTMAEAVAEFNALSTKFKEKTDKQREAKKREEKETITTAKHLLTELQALVENEENIAKAFNGFNAIQDKWKSLPKVSNDAYRDLNAEYNKHAEKFFYNINIYKELKELDLKHNLEQKLLVLEDQKKLEEMNDIRRMEVEVRLNQDRWNEIGPTFKEEWDKIKDEFWNITRNIYKKIQDFYNQRREQQNKNLSLKENLLSKINQINALELKSHKKWQEKTEEVIAVQKEWKMVGYVPKDKTGVWKDFRKGSDAFFDKKRAFYKEIRDEQNTNKDQKMELLRQAEELKDSEDWSATSAALIQLQKQWKTVGPAHQRDENRMWRKFRQACDQFFQKRKSHRSDEAVEFDNNLKAKKELITEMEKFEPGADRNANIEALKEFAEKWRNIGHVPFKLKDKINKEYKKTLDEKYGLLKIDRKEKEKIRFEQKLEDIKETDNNDFLIRKEQDNIRARISKLNNEAIQLENNIGFFANSKGAEKLKAEVERKIDKVKNEINELKERLTMLREAI